mgnify:CR=1 FL=1
MFKAVYDLIQAVKGQLMSVVPRLIAFPLKFQENMTFFYYYTKTYFHCNDISRGVTVYRHRNVRELVFFRIGKNAPPLCRLSMCVCVCVCIYI